MKTMLLLIFSGFSSVMFAQITYNGSTMAGLGDTIFLAEDTSHVSALDLGEAAGDQVWDFTTVMEEKPDGAILEDPSTAPLNNLFPDADFVGNDLYEDSIHLFFKKTSTALDIVGVVEYDSNGNPEPGILSGNWRFMQFPAQFETTFSSVVLRDTFTAELGVDFDGIGPHPYVDSLRTVVKFSFFNEIDAWGEVQLPQGNFNTIRQKTSTILNFKTDCFYDSAWHDLTPTMDTIFEEERNDTTKDATYRWWTADAKVNFYVCQMETDTNGMPDSSFSYTTETPTEPAGILTLDDAHISVYPNPATEVLNIELSDPMTGIVTLYDVNARPVLVQQLNEVNTQLQLGQLATGVYLLQLTDDSGNLVELRKIRINR